MHFNIFPFPFSFTAQSCSLAEPCEDNVPLLSVHGRIHGASAVSCKSTRLECVSVLIQDQSARKYKKDCKYFFLLKDHMQGCS